MKLSLKKINNLDYDSRLNFLRISISKNKGGRELNELLNLMQEFPDRDHDEALQIYFQNAYDPISGLFRFKESTNFDLLKISHLFLNEMIDNFTYNFHTYIKFIIFISDNKNKNLSQSIVYILNTLEGYICSRSQNKPLDHFNIIKIINQIMISLQKNVDFNQVFDLILKIKPLDKQTLIQLKIVSKDPELSKKIDDILMIENIVC